MTKRLYCYGVMVSRATPATTTHSMVHGYITATSEDEVRGHAVTVARMRKPDFSIDDIAVLEIDLDAVNAALAGQVSENGPQEE